MLSGATKGVATIAGSITFVLAATGAFLELQAALNAIWRVAPNPAANLSAYVLDRLRSFGIVVSIAWCCGCITPSQILLFGAEFTRIYSRAAGERPQPEDFAKRDPNAAVKST